MEEQEVKAPVRVRLLFADRHLLSKAQRSEGLRRCWVIIRPELNTVAEFSRDISSRFGLSCSSSHGLLLSMDGFLIPPSESTSIFRDNDKIRVKGDIIKEVVVEEEEEEEAVATSASAPQIKGNEIINNGGDATEKKNRKKERKRPLPDEPSLNRKRKEVERPTCPKKKKLKLGPVIINEKRENNPAVATPSEFQPVNQQKNALVLASERHQQGASISKSISTRLHGVSNDKNANGTWPGYGTQQQSLQRNWVPGQTRFMSPGAGPSNWQDNGSKKPFQGDKTMTKKTSWKPRSGFDSPNAHNRNWQPWIEFSSPNSTNSQLRMDNNVTTEEAPEKTIPYREEINKDKLDFESLYPLPRLPREGDIIAYRLDIIDSLGCPELSSFRKLQKVLQGTCYVLLENPSMQHSVLVLLPDKILNIMYTQKANQTSNLTEVLSLDLIATFLPSYLGNSVNYNQVREVIVFDPVLMIIFLCPLPEYPTPECELSEFEKSMYKEDGSLEIDFECLVDLRLVKESQVRTALKMHKSGKWKSKSKASNWQNSAESSLSLLGGNNNNTNSAWEVGQASNEKEATESGWGAWPPSTSRAGASGPSTGQYGARFGSHGNFSRGRKYRDGDNGNSNWAWEANDEAANANEGTRAQNNSWDTWAPTAGQASALRSRDGDSGNSNWAWEANDEVANANEGTRAQNNGWDTWAPSADRASASWSRMGQHGSGFGSWGNFSRGGRRGDSDNSNSNSAWEANDEAENANEGTQSQNNGWDTWAPSANQASASWSRTGQHGNGFGSWGGFSRGGRRGRDGKYFNRKFNK